MERNKTLFLQHTFNKKRLVQFVWTAFRLILLIGLVFMILYPLLVRFSASIKSPADQSNPSVMFIPKEPTFANYKTVIRSIGYGETLLYSTLFTALTSFLQTAMCLVTAYGLARFQFKGNRLVFGMAIFTLVIPPQALLLPLYFRFKSFNLLQLFKFSGDLWGLDLTGTIVPFLLLSVTAMAFRNGLYIFMFNQYYRNVPAVLEEAAYIDGCSIFKTFLKIMVPGAKSMIISVFLFAFVWQWNDSFYVSMLAKDLPVLSNQLYGLSYSILGASSDIYTALLETPKFFLLIVPLLILYLFTQRFFVASIETSGIVG